VSPVRVRLITKPECHLCDDAREALAAGIARTGVEADVVEESILDDPELYARYWDEIPVVIIEDRVHTIWRVTPARLDEALRKAAQ
jgi:hypothetical protein